MAGGNCAAGDYLSGSFCTVHVAFSPLAPGTRNGAVVLYDRSSPANALATVYISGTGVGPAIGFGPGIISTVAGNGIAGYNGDSIDATSAELNFAYDAVVDAVGNIYIADYVNQRIRKVNAATGIITTVVGTGYSAGNYGGYNGDHIPATSAELNSAALVLPSMARETSTLRIFTMPGFAGSTPDPA